MSINRIPLNVDHYETNRNNNGTSRSKMNNNNIGSSSNGFTKEYRSSSSSGRFARPEPFGMDNMMDETERIKNRMKEFEERCRKWREEVFGKTSSLINDDMAGKRDTSFLNDQRVPFVNDTKPTVQTHRSYIQDSANGSKKYRIDLEIGDYKQNELMLSSNGNVLIIKGDRELVNGSTSEKKTFNREITLPDYVDMSKIEANLIENKSVVDSTSYSNLLEIEAPIIMDKYSFRRSAFDKSQSLIRPKQTFNNTSSSSSTSTSNQSNQPLLINEDNNNNNNNINYTNNGSRFETNKHESYTTTSSSSKSTTTTTTTKHGGGVGGGVGDHASNRKGSVYDLNMNFTDDNFARSPSKPNLKSNPELMPGYPLFDNSEGCVVYKFDLRDFDQSDIQLTITVDRTLEIKASKQQVDNYGKVYHEFKREIVLEAEVDPNLIKNVLHEGILTIKIPKAAKSNGIGSISNNHNLQAPNGFKEIYTDDGVLTKLNADFKGYNPENVKIVLSANNVLKVSASQQEVGVNNNGSVQKECTRQYTLPNWVQPENMKATMSRDGLLTVDFLGKK